MTCSDNTCGTGVGTVILPGDPSGESIVTASPAFGGVEVSWTMPSTNPSAVAFTKVFRSYTSSFNAALVIASSGGDRFFDRFDWTTGLAAVQYYWVVFVSINGTESVPHGPAAAVPRQTIDQIIENLTAQIDYSMLSVEMKTQVDKADLYQVAQESVNGLLSAEQVSIRDAIALVQSDLEESFVLISNEVTARQSAEQAFASSINTLAVATEENLATAQTSLQASIDSVTGDVSAMYTAKLTVNGLVGGFGLANNGTSVEAGFDVDTFWVGRTAANKKKPFIIQNNEVFIDQAVIKNAAIDFAKINTATINNLSSITQKVGQITMQRDPDTATYIRFGKTSATDVTNTGFWIGVDSSGNPGVAIGGPNGLFKYTYATGLQVAGEQTSVTSPGSVVASGVLPQTYTWVNNTGLYTSFTLKLVGGGGGGGGIGNDIRVYGSGGSGGNTTATVRNSSGTSLNTYTASGGAGGSGRFNGPEPASIIRRTPVIITTDDGYAGGGGWFYYLGYYAGNGAVGGYSSQAITIPLGGSISISVGDGGAGNTAYDNDGYPGHSGAFSLTVVGA